MRPAGASDPDRPPPAIRPGDVPAGDVGELNIAGITDDDPTELDVIQGPPATAGFFLGSLVERLPQPPIDRLAPRGIVGGSRHAGQAPVEVYEGSHVRVTRPRDGHRTLSSSRMRRTSCDAELASPRVEGDRTDHPVSREGIMNGEPGDLAGIGRERAQGRTIFMTSSP